MLWGIVGLVVGALVAWVVAARAARGLREDLGAARSRAEVAEALHQATLASLERERADHGEAVANMETLFEATSSRVLATSMTQFNETQERILRERDS